MYPYELQHRRGEPLENRGDYKVDLMFELYIIKSIFELIMYSFYYKYPDYKNERTTDYII